MANACTTASGTPPLSTSFSLQEATATQAQASVEGRNAENLQSEGEKSIIYSISETLSSGWDSCKVGVGGGGDRRHHFRHTLMDKSKDLLLIRGSSILDAPGRRAGLAGV